MYIMTTLLIGNDRSAAHVLGAGSVPLALLEHVRYELLTLGEHEWRATKMRCSVPSAWTTGSAIPALQQLCLYYGKM